MELGHHWWYREVFLRRMALTTASVRCREADELVPAQSARARIAAVAVQQGVPLLALADAET